MSVDQYSVCPCGSGKKIKFCKCKDSIHEMERVLKMMSGGQMVAALDRLNQVLEEHPDAAWCLAIRGRLLLELKEDQALAENAERFIRLQPSNPLALTQQAAYRGVCGETQSAAESLLQALAESSHGVDTFVLDVASVLSLSFAQAGNLLSSRCFAGLALTAQGYENERLASMAVEQVNRSREISNMLKDVPTLDVKPKTPAVRERYDEASVLLRANQILLAESKFESLARSNPQEEAVLRGLLVCAIWRGDAKRQSQILKKLSEVDTIDADRRARDLALSVLLAPDQPEICTPCSNYTWEIEDLAMLEQELIASSRVVQLPPDVIRMAGNTDENEVPPRSGFQLLDRELTETDKLPAPDVAPLVLTNALLFGKQTDRPARLELLSVCSSELDEAMKFFNAFSAVSGEPKVNEDTIPLMSAASVNMPIMRVAGTQAEARKLQTAVTNREFVRRVLATPLPLFDGKTPGETLEDEAFSLQRTALVRVIESYDVMYDDPAVLDQLRTALKVDALKPIDISDDEQVYSLPVDALYRVNVESATHQQLYILLDRARNFRCTPVQRATAQRLLSIDLGEDEVRIKPHAYISLIDVTSDEEKAMELLAEAKTWAKANGVSHAPMLLNECVRRVQSGDSEGFQSVVQEIIADFSNDAAVMGQLQQMLVELGLINPDGSPRQGPPQGGAPMGVGSEPPAPPAGGGGGLWTPDSPTPPQTPGEGSKLWVPGS
ncbi:protein-disulfide isomerase [Rosistilla oblonga]|uniref:protein-disulfide isomerase n=1 Tax=Rosistilla oblonga TaxID=2527990 RepID=UPI003A96971C